MEKKKKNQQVEQPTLLEFLHVLAPKLEKKNQEK